MRSILLLAILSAVSLSCPDKDERCIACNGTKCLECADSFLNAQGQCQIPQIKVDNCAQYKSDGACAYCIPGYYTNTQAKCVKISVEGCSELASATTCSICNNGVISKDGVCNKNNKCTIENCDMCMAKTSGEICTRCKNGYVVFIEKGNYSCKKESGAIKNCLYLNSNNSEVCAVCDYNFFMKNQNCEKSSQYKLDVSGVRITGSIIGLVLFFLVK